MKVPNLSSSMATKLNSGGLMGPKTPKKLLDTIG